MQFKKISFLPTHADGIGNSWGFGGSLKLPKIMGCLKRK